MLELKVQELKTKDSLIMPDELKNALDNDTNCLIYQSPGGYFAMQDARMIYEAAAGRCSVILDVSGCLGDPVACNGRHSDIMVGSFGRSKPVEVGYGGFVSFKHRKDYEYAQEIFNTTAFDDEYLEPLYEKLLRVPGRLQTMYRECEKIKQELNDYPVLHSDRKGIVVVVAYTSEKQKSAIISYCERNKYEYTQCPRYIRVMRDAISIEVKRGGFFERA
jgi:hypothetical protein